MISDFPTVIHFTQLPSDTNRYFPDRKNPTQFNNANDLANYPNTINADLEKLERLACDVVYIPTIEDLYENEEKAKTFDFGSLMTDPEKLGAYYSIFESQYPKDFDHTNFHCY